MDLSIQYCADLKSILPRGHVWPICTSLRSLHISGCDKLRTLPRALRNLHCLEDIHVEACCNLSSFPSIKGIASSLQRLCLCCSDEVLPPGLQSCVSLPNLFIYNWPHLISIPDLRNLHSRTHLQIDRCPNLISIPDPKELPSLLTRLQISYCSKLKSIPDLKELPSLTRLEIMQCSNLISIPVLKELSSLTLLRISSCPNLISISPKFLSNKKSKLFDLCYVCFCLKMCFSDGKRRGGLRKANGLKFRWAKCKVLNHG